MELVCDRQHWEVDTNDVLGEGGFGRVVSAIGDDGSPAVAKFIPKDGRAARDLLAVELPASEHLIPVLDSGESGDSWVIVMPRADYSLRDYLARNSVQLPEALDILSQIAQGLSILDGTIVHRDLKPENILHLNGNWAICDFGISRYAEETTAADTQKFSFTPPYAAPEQWKLERASAATDVYALGVIACELCAGKRPFVGPGTDEYRDQHLHANPSVEGLNTRLSSLITECLLKSPGARPDALNLVERLQRAGEDSKKPGARRLAEAERAVTDLAAEQARRAEVARTESERRSELLAGASTLHRLITSELAETVQEEAPTAAVEDTNGVLTIRLGEGVLTASAVRAGLPQALGNLDVVAFAMIGISRPMSQFGYRGRTHSLYYCDYDVPGRYGWFEVAFMDNALLGGGQRSTVPFALDPALEVSTALTMISTTQLAFGFLPVPSDSLDEFLDRWLGYLGGAAHGTLERPMTLPEGATHGLKR